MRNLALGIIPGAIAIAWIALPAEPRFACACVGIAVLVGAGLFYHVREEV